MFSLLTISHKYSEDLFDGIFKYSTLSKRTPEITTGWININPFPSRVSRNRPKIDRKIAGIPLEIRCKERGNFFVREKRYQLQWGHKLVRGSDSQSRFPRDFRDPSREIPDWRYAAGKSTADENRSRRVRHSRAAPSHVFSDVCFPTRAMSLCGNVFRRGNTVKVRYMHIVPVVFDGEGDLSGWKK